MANKLIAPKNLKGKAPDSGTGSANAAVFKTHNAAMAADQAQCVIRCPMCAFMKVLSGTPLIVCDNLKIVQQGKAFEKLNKAVTKDPKFPVSTAVGKWGAFEETVKSAYLKFTRKNRRKIDEFDESSEHVIPEGLTDFIEDEEKKKGKK